MNRREMMKVAAAALVGGPAAIEAARRAEALALYQPRDFTHPLVMNCRTAWPGYRMVKTNPAAVELARSMCK